MPQLEAATFISQLLWLAVTFVGLYLLMWKVVIPRVADVLQDRQERIDDDLEKAEALRNEAAAVLEAYEKTVADGRARAQAILREAADQNDKAAAIRQTALGEQLAQQTAEAEARINEAREEALTNIRSVAAETAQAAALRLSGATITQDEAEGSRRVRPGGGTLMAALHTAEFWVAIGFIILVLAIAKKSWAAIKAGLDARAERIRTSLDDATKLREEAQHLLAEYQRKQRDAAKEIDDLLAAARAEAERSSINAARGLEELVKRREQLAIDKIAQAESDALHAVRNTAVDVAIAATRKLLGDKLTAATASGLVDNAIAELPQKLH